MVTSAEPVRRAIAVRVAEAIADRTRGSVQLSGVTFDWKLAPCFRNLHIYTRQGEHRLDVASKQACVERWFSAIGSGFRAVRVRLDTPKIELRREPEGSGDRPFVVARPEPRRSASPQRAALQELTVVFDGLSLEWAKLPVPEQLADGTFGPIDGRITVQRRGPLSAMSIAIQDRDRATRLDGRATPTADGWDLAAGVQGDMVRLFGPILTALDLDIRKMPCRGRLGARYGDRKLTLDLDLEQYDVDFAANVLSSGRLVGLTGRQQLRMTANLDTGTVMFGPGLIELNGVPVEAAGRVFPSGGEPAFLAELSVPTISMGRLLGSIPSPAVRDVARHIDPSIRFSLSFEVRGLLSDAATWEPKLDYQLVGVTPEARTGLEALSGPFLYRPLTAEDQRGPPVRRGPRTEGWVRYSRIPYLFRRAIIIAEDATFPFHRGVELEEVKKVIEAAVRRGDRVRGGSTLTQQLVKNLFLSRDRTALRKAAELLLTFHLESVLDKRRIFELYANLIEWGPGIYGLNAAAHHYFGRPPQALAPVEMVYLATIIPSPIRYHKHFERGVLPERHRRKVTFLLARLHRLGQLSDDEFEIAQATPIEFARQPRR